MKFFGWGRKKDPPPIQPAPHLESKNSDAARSTHESPGSDQLFGQDRQSKALSREGVESRLGWEERLQETIRFVFRHEQEGLLAIGTFAIDQLAEATPLDQIKPPAAPAPQVNSEANTKVNPKVNSHCNHSVNSHCNHSVSSLQVANLAIHEVSSSDDEVEPQQLPSPVPAYPVFSASSSGPRSPIRLISVGSTKAEISSPPPTAHQSDPAELQSPGLCGLFPSRSRRTQREDRKKPPENREKPPENRQGTSHGSVLKRITGSRRWRSGYTLSAKVSPEKTLNPSTDPQPSQAQGPPCIANVVKEGGPIPSQPWEVGDQRRRRGHSFGWACAENGKWIRTDSEFVVLEM